MMKKSVNLALLDSEITRLQVLNRLYDIILMIFSDNLIKKEDVAEEIMDLVEKAELFMPRCFYEKEKAEN